MQSRRSFFSKMAVAAAAPSLLVSRAFSAEETKAVKLTTDDPVAKALGYSEDTATVDPKKYPQHKAEQRCDGCALYTGKNGEKDGPCTAFQNKIVTAHGWCSAFAAKPPAAPAIN
ncbi:MAG: high-potential iron-sulfur protein [Verrucomicrobiota bacterium JB025]|nr:high-potential iron-sulfur protein [Verrucomicrobiota bacterium JB025]